MAINSRVSSWSSTYSTRRFSCIALVTIEEIQQRSEATARGTRPHPSQFLKSKFYVKAFKKGRGHRYHLMVGRCDNLGDPNGLAANLHPRSRFVCTLSDKAKIHEVR